MLLVKGGLILTSTNFRKNDRSFNRRIIKLFFFSRYIILSANLAKYYPLQKWVHIIRRFLCVRMNFEFQWYFFLFQARWVYWLSYTSFFKKIFDYILLTYKQGLLHRCNSANASYLFQQDKTSYDVSYDTGDKTFVCGRRNDVFKLWLYFKSKVILFLYFHLLVAYCPMHVNTW